MVFGFLDGLGFVFEKVEGLWLGGIVWDFIREVILILFVVKKRFFNSVLLFIVRIAGRLEGENFR